MGKRRSLTFAKFVDKQSIFSAHQFLQALEVTPQAAMNAHSDCSMHSHRALRCYLLAWDWGLLIVQLINKAIWGQLESFAQTPVAEKYVSFACIQQCLPALCKHCGAAVCNCTLRAKGHGDVP